MRALGSSGQHAVVSPLLGLLWHVPALSSRTLNASRLILRHSNVRGAQATDFNSTACHGHRNLSLEAFRRELRLEAGATKERTLEAVSSTPLFGMVGATLVALPLSEPCLSTLTVSGACYRTSCMGRIRGRGRGRPSETRC